MAQKPKADSKGKKEKKVKKTSKKWEQYQAGSSSVERKNKFCPKCGVGVFMANHKNRVTCGKCNYTEFSGKSEEKA